MLDLRAKIVMALSAVVGFMSVIALLAIIPGVMFGWMGLELWLLAVPVVLVVSAMSILHEYSRAISNIQSQMMDEGMFDEDMMNEMEDMMGEMFGGGMDEEDMGFDEQEDE